MVAAVSGIGWMVLDASNYLRSDIMFFGIILMGITGIVLDQILKFSGTLYGSLERKELGGMKL